MAAILPPGVLHYGMQLPIQSQSKLYAEDWEETAGPDDLAAVAQACDRGGFAYIAVCDHTAIPRSHAPMMGTEWWDTMTTLGWLAGITSNVRLVSHVAVLAYRHPMMTAKAFATLDVISKGRAIVTYEGKRYSVDDMGQKPRPVQSPRPPIWIGGSAGAALKRVAKYADGWLPQGSPRETFPQQVEELRRLREEYGRGDEPIDVGAITEMLYVGTPDREVGKHTL
ncbi:MAG: LLM class flavin-dependent oxidoreductase, partial [Streptomycetaceae bacterium]|nr:LLM class flavin-dependent oxidoreductase [Streptomycetaceae bacterium]